MSSPRYLNYEVALLLAKYGKRAVIKALASKLNLTMRQLEDYLETPDKLKRAACTHKINMRIDLIGALSIKHPKKAQCLRVLLDRFENRSFLPKLRDVRHFFNQHQRVLGKASSRAQTLAKLLKLLAELDDNELNELCQFQLHNEYSSLGIIADEILRRKE